MNDQETPQVPFDAVSAPPPLPAEPVAPVAPDASARGFGRTGVLVAAIVALGFGQGLAFAWFFAGRDARLSPEIPRHAPAAIPEGPPAAVRSGSVSGGKGAGEEALVPAATEPTPEPEAPRTPHVLDNARDMLDRGDVSGARRVASGFLLQIDGMSRQERDRAAAAYALLGDVLRAEYSASLTVAANAPAPAAPPPAAQGDRK